MSSREATRLEPAGSNRYGERQVVRPFLVSLVFLALAFCGNCSRDAKTQSSAATSMTQKPVAPLTLTSESATGSFPVSAETLAARPAIVEVPISRVVNPSGIALEISVYLTEAGRAGKPEGERVVVGRFSLFPSDRPGKFLLDSSSALRKIGAAVGGEKEKALQLVIELKRVDESKPWTQVEITVEQPIWRRE